ncbi:hypothetical protein [Massilia sp. CF038]|uniref:hypothetical protein n=1 Tax=Massilia sp. CF038 TaxID=1881045 RepID=UPI000918B70C|nr:hypothetical protein [Massilia sp. CF038]SHH45517.1 hypothetical protein SAMN05428948_4107 [Massilia sp. CF038]
MKTKVCLSVDTEFSIGGAFIDTRNVPIAEKRVWCDVEGKSEGLGFILDCLERHRITATFFVEALQQHYFKHDPMAPIAQRLHGAGHEVQLHVHPCWHLFQHEDWKERLGQKSRVDAFFGRDEDESLALIQDAMAIFAGWGIPAPTVFRSASLQHDAALYRATARAGIPYSSNIGVAIFDSGDPDYKLYGGRHLRHGVIECPILTFSDWDMFGKQHLKTLTITGTSFAETRTLLERAQRAGIEQVVILTHPFEYVQCGDFTMREMRRNRLNQRRLEQVAAYLDARRDLFDTCGIGAAASMPMAATSANNALLKGRLLQALPRMASQYAYERYGKWQLARMARQPRPVAAGTAPIADLA